MIDWKNTPIHKLPLAPPAELVLSNESLYDYRKPAVYKDYMPTFEELRNMVNSGDYTFRDFIYDLCPAGHIYYILEGDNHISGLPLRWSADGARLKPKGEKYFAKLMESEVIIHERGVLFIRYKNANVVKNFVMGAGGYADDGHYFECMP